MVEFNRMLFQPRISITSLAHFFLTSPGAQACNRARQSLCPQRGRVFYYTYSVPLLLILGSRLLQSSEQSTTAEFPPAGQKIEDNDKPVSHAPYSIAGKRPVRGHQLGGLLQVRRAGTSIDYSCARILVLYALVLVLAV